MAERHSVLDRIICMVLFLSPEIHRMKLGAHCALCFLSWHCDLVFEFVCMSQHKLMSSGQTFVLLQKHGLGPHGERTALTELWPGEWTKIHLNLLKASLWRTHAVNIFFTIRNVKANVLPRRRNTFVSTHFPDAWRYTCNDKKVILKNLIV